MKISQKCRYLPIIHTVRLSLDISAVKRTVCMIGRIEYVHWNDNVDSENISIHCDSVGKIMRGINDLMTGSHGKCHAGKVTEGNRH